MTVTQLDTPVEVKPEDMDVDQLRDEIWSTLCKIEGHHTTIRADLIENPFGAGFLTPEGRRVQGEQHARDVEARKERLKDGQAVGVGESPVPGSLSNLSIDAQVWVTVRLLIHDLTDFTEKASGKPFPHHAPPEGALLWDVAWHLNVVIGTIDDPAPLAKTLRKLRRLADDTTRVVEGEQRMLLDAPCPWCGNKTLVVYLRDHVVRCERDRGQVIPCICPFALCDCKRNPIAHQHAWHRDRESRRDGWWGLVDQMTQAARRATNKKRGASS